MSNTWELSKGLAAVVTASAVAFGLCPSAAADPAAAQPTPQPNSTQQLPGLPALSQLSPIIQQAAGNPEQATQLLMAAAQAFTSHNPTAPTESKNVAASVNQFVHEPGTPGSRRAGSGPRCRHPALPTPRCPTCRQWASSRVCSRTCRRVSIQPTRRVPRPLRHRRPPRRRQRRRRPVRRRLRAAAAPGFGPDAPTTQDFMYPSIGTNCLADGSSALAAALSVAGPAAIPAPGPGPGQTAYVFTAVGTPGPAEVQKLPLNVTWVNLTTGKSGSVTLKPRSDINADGPTTLTAIADTGSGSIMSTIFGQVTTKERQCQFMPTIGSTVVP